MTVRETLRAGTRALHAEAEARVDLLARCAEIESYANLVRRLLAWWAPVEAQLAALPWLSIDFDFDGRRKAHLLAADLRALRVVPAARRCLDLPRIADLDAGMGALYVLEGSTLGARGIIREVRRRLGIDAGRGASFHAGYGDRTGAMWRAFERALEARCGAHEDRRAAALAGARGTFRSFNAWFASETSRPRARTMER